jgi:hypothetical protein
MANFQLYTQAFVYINSSLLAEEAEVRIARTTNAQDVLTVAKGLAGQSPGAGMTTISVTNAVPAADFEFDPGQFMNTLEPVEITVQAAGKTMTIKGFIPEDGFSHSVNAESRLEFSVKGNFGVWE